MVKRKSNWTPVRAPLEGRQVNCLIASEGHLWMRDYFDRFPSVVRRRLAESAFNICPACMDEEAHTAARQRNETKPSEGTYLLVIKSIEQNLNNDGQAGTFVLAGANSGVARTPAVRYRR